MTTKRKEIKKLYGFMFKSVREAMQLSVGEMAKYMNVSQATISLYENNKRMPNIETFLWYMEKANKIQFAKRECTYCHGNGTVVLAYLTQDQNEDE